MSFRESETVELKEILIDDIKKEIIAFANCNGGVIYIGVCDDGTIVGVEHADEVIQQISNMVRDAIKPDLTMFVAYRQERHGKHDILAVTVQRGTGRPYYLAGKGLRPAGVFVRQGTSSAPASDTVIRQLIKETDGDSFEEMRSMEQGLTFAAVEEEFKKRKICFGDQQRQTLHLCMSEGIYTNLALLLSDQCMHTIKAAVFQGADQSVFKDRREFSGSLMRQMNDVYEYIDMHNNTQSTFDKLQRIDRRDYPEVALREALLNTLVHRDYGFGASSLISIYADRIELVSIGGLLSGISLGDVMMGLSVCRNPRLANVFYRLELIEAYGTGLRKIMNAYEGTGKKPIIEASDNAFKITLPNINAKENREDADSSYKEKQQRLQTEAQNFQVREVNEMTASGFTVRKTPQQLILRILDTGGAIARQDVQQLLGVSQTTAGRILKKMVDDGILMKEGKGKNTVYYKA